MIPLPVLESYVSAAVGTPITISCEAESTFAMPTSDGGVTSVVDGFVLYGADGGLLRVLHVRQSVCSWAQAADRKQSRTPTAYLVFQGQRMDVDSGAALEVLLHEAMHVALQSGDESVVECAAFRNRWALVKQFRLPAFVSNMLMAGMAWRHDAAPAQYHGVGGC